MRFGMLSLGVVAMASIALAQTPAYRAPRTADGKPNLNGIWQAMNTANWDLEPHAAGMGYYWQDGAIGAIPPGIGVVDGGTIPYLPAALAKKKEKKEPKEIICGNCNYVFTSMRNCPECGFGMIAKDKGVPTHKADLKEVKKVTKHSLGIDPALFYGELLGWCVTNGKNRKIGRAHV